MLFDSWSCSFRVVAGGCILATVGHSSSVSLVDGVTALALSTLVETPAAGRQP